MSIRSVITTREDFTGEFPVKYAASGLWRFDETEPENIDGEYRLSDSSDKKRYAVIHNWNSPTAALLPGKMGNYFRLNTNDPATEQTYLRIANDGTIFENLGERIVVGGWINPTTYSVGSAYAPIFNTRYGPGNPIFYLSLYYGKLRLMLYDSAGTLIMDEDLTAPITLQNGGWYFIAAIIEPSNKKAYYVLCDRSAGTTWTSAAMAWTGELNRSCTADIILGMHADGYWWAGGFDDWFLDTNSSLTSGDLINYFKSTYFSNGGDVSAAIDAYSESGTVMLHASDGVYPLIGEYVSPAVPCAVSGTGKVAVTSEYTAGVTSVSLVETSTSDDLTTWNDWQMLGSSGEINSPNLAYIRFRITLTTNDNTKTPKLLTIQLNDILPPPYAKLGYARPVLLDREGNREAVLERAYNIIVTGELNGADTLEFSIPYNDAKRDLLENEKKIQIVNDTYVIRTITDEKDANGKIISNIYAEASFYDLAYSEEKTERDFKEAPPSLPMRYALSNTDWSVGNVTVNTRITWTSSEKNALAVLRAVQSMYGGDLIFDCANKQVHLLSFSGNDCGAVFAYRKNLKTIQRTVDTRNLITRMYAFGKNGMSFSTINEGKSYVEDFSYSNEIRTSTLDCSNFTNPYQMLEYAQSRLSDYSKPRVSYVLNAMDLSVLTDYAHESWDLGDIVSVEDEELHLSVKTRIVRREYHLQEPWKTVLELSTTLHELSDEAARWDNAAETTSRSAESGSDMTPFNLLRNSRADMGTAYWINSGFEVSGTDGVTGSASFKGVGSLGMTKSLTQTVYPANRDYYTFTAQAATENLKKDNENSMVGIEITVEYEDGTIETQFVRFM